VTVSGPTHTERETEEGAGREGNNGNREGGRETGRGGRRERGGNNAGE
jgi:hypothetical protein